MCPASSESLLRQPSSSGIVAGKKVVVFARFVPEIDAISRMLTKKSIGHAIIKGDVTDRAEQVQAFQTNPEVKVFIGQLATTGMGLTLTAGTVAVYYSLDFRITAICHGNIAMRRSSSTGSSRMKQRWITCVCTWRGTLQAGACSAIHSSCRRITKFMQRWCV